MGFIFPPVACLKRGRFDRASWFRVRRYPTLFLKTRSGDQIQKPMRVGGFLPSERCGSLASAPGEGQLGSERGEGLLEGKVSDYPIPILNPQIGQDPWWKVRVVYKGNQFTKFSVSKKRAADFPLEPDLPRGKRSLGRLPSQAPSLESWSGESLPLLCLQSKTSSSGPSWFSGLSNPFLKEDQRKGIEEFLGRKYWALAQYGWWLHWQKLSSGKVVSCRRIPGGMKTSKEKQRNFVSGFLPKERKWGGNK